METTDPVGYGYEAVQPHEIIQPKVGEASPTFFLVTTKGIIAPPTVETFADEATLVEALKLLFQRAANEPVRFAACRAFVFYGSRCQLGGNPVRGITMPDGRFVPITPNGPLNPDDQSDWVLPRALRVSEPG